MRLTGSSVRLVVGLRSEVPSGFDTAALPELPVTTLSEKASEQLLDRHHPGLDPRIRRLVLDEAQGNPLALLELPPYVRGNRTGRTPEELFGYTGIPLPLRLQHVYGARIAALGDAVRAELLRGALDGVGAGTTTVLAGGTRYRMVEADEAAACGLLDIDPLSGDFVFRHPLVRSAVVQKATPNERRAAHAVLAQVHRDDLERRATHLAASTVDPDEEAAATLEAAADSAILRGGALAAVAWLTRAAELSESPEERSRRLGSAAYIAGHSGRLDQARRLVRSGTGSGITDSPASAVTSGYVALFEDGDVRSSQRQVFAAIESMRDSGVREPDEVLTRLVDLLLAINQYASDEAAWERTHELLGPLGDLVPSHSRIYQDAWGDVVRRGAGVRERVERAFADLRDLEPWDITRLGVAAYHVDTLSHYRPHLQRTVDREVETGAVADAMTMLHLIMLDQIGVGEWAEAEHTGQRCLEVTTAHGHALFVLHTQAYLGLLAALRGEVERARELQATVEAWARPRGVGFLTQITDAIGTTAALAEGDYEAAYLHAIGITPPGTFQPYAHQAPAPSSTSSKQPSTPAAPNKPAHTPSPPKTQASRTSPPPRPHHLRRPRHHHHRPHRSRPHVPPRRIPPRRPPLPLRTRAHPPRPRHPPTSHPRTQSRTAIPHPGHGIIRAAGRTHLDRTRPGRTQGIRPDHAHHVRPARRTHLAGTPDRRPRRQRPDQQRDRRTHAPVPPHRQLTPLPRLPQTRHHLTRRPARRTGQDPRRPERVTVPPAAAARRDPTRGRRGGRVRPASRARSRRRISIRCR